MSGKKRKRSAAVGSIFALIVLLAAGILIERRIPTKKRMSAEQYFGITEEDQIGIAADAVRSETTGRVIDGVWYIDYESVRLLTPAFWYDREEQLLVMTGASEKCVIPLGDPPDEVRGELRVEKEILYLSCDLVKQYADIELTRYEQPKRLYIETVFEYPEAAAAKAAPVRCGAGIKSPVIAEVREGELLRLTDRNADGTDRPDKTAGWTGVVTKEGFIGFIEDRFLADVRVRTKEHERTAEAFSRHFLNETVNLCFHQTTDQASNNALEKALEGTSGINVLAPTWFFLDSESGELTSLVSEAYVKLAHDRGIRVWPVINDFDGAVSSSEATSRMLGSYAARTEVIEKVTADLLACGADGLNLDFEKVRAESAPAYIEFIRELAVSMQKNGLTLSVDNYVPKYTRYMKRREQAVCADYIVVMCYDEHTSGSEKAGPVASLAFTEKGIAQTLQEVPPEQVIAAVPFFTRIWTTKDGEKPSSRAYGMRDAENALKERGMTAAFDAETGLNYAEAKTDEGLVQVWLEDEMSLNEKMRVIRESGCAGTAAWKLGLEKPEIWGVIKDGAAK